MRVVNRFKLSRFRDYVVLRFGFSESSNAEDLGEVVEELFLPLTTVALLGGKLFEAMLNSIVDLNQFFTALQPMFNALSEQSNKSTEELARAAVEQAKQQLAGGGGTKQ